MFRTDVGFSEFTILTLENTQTQRAVPESGLRHHGTPNLRSSVSVKGESYVDTQLDGRLSTPIGFMQKYRSNMVTKSRFSQEDGIN